MEKKNNLLSDTEAAIYLGITKELLFAYVKNAPKKHKGETRKLSSVTSNGQNYFTKEELDSFDAYLKELGQLLQKSVLQFLHIFENI